MDEHALAALAQRRVNRAQLEHVIHASAAISGDNDIFVIGSQAILGQFPSPPPELTISIEADVYPRNKPEHADLIDARLLRQQLKQAAPFTDQG